MRILTSHEALEAKVNAYEKNDHKTRTLTVMERDLHTKVAETEKAMKTLGELTIAAMEILVTKVARYEAALKLIILAERDDPGSARVAREALLEGSE